MAGSVFCVTVVNSGRSLFESVELSFEMGADILAASVFCVTVVNSGRSLFESV